MLGEALLLGSAGIFSPIVGQGIYNRRKDASERIQGLEADLQELDEESSFRLDTGRKFLDRDRTVLSSKTLEADIDVDVDFSQDEYDSPGDVLEGESNIVDLGQNTLSNMVEEYTPFDSKIDRYDVTFNGDGGSLKYSVADTDFFEAFNDDGDRELNSAEDVYQETLDENVDNYWNLT